ncbi:MAG TPA: hypothetical protein PKE16_02325 [Hyphomicrobium sp.]|nr:hypothetical protein [Hyphomicrobium sp.]
MQKYLLIPALYLLGIQGLHCEDFHGQNCVDGCPELKQGYKWAQDQDTHDPYACLGRSQDFYKGCSAYVLEAGPKMPPPKKQKSPGSDLDDDATRRDRDRFDQDRQGQDRYDQDRDARPDQRQ